MKSPERRADVASVERIVGSISPLLAGQPPEVQGAALADLLATWLAGHIRPGDPGETDATRERLLASHVEQVRILVGINAAIIHREGAPLLIDIEASRAKGGSTFHVYRFDDGSVQIRKPHDNEVARQHDVHTINLTAPESKSLARILARKAKQVPIKEAPDPRHPELFIGKKP